MITLLRMAFSELRSDKFFVHQKFHSPTEPFQKRIDRDLYIQYTTRTTKLFSKVVAMACNFSIVMFVQTLQSARLLICSYQCTGNYKAWIKPVDAVENPAGLL